MENVENGFERLLDDCVDFAQRLIRTPSMPGDEGQIAELVAAELDRLDYDEVWIDEAGNACGRMYGRDRELPALVLNSHLDHVDPGDPELWPTSPYAAEIVDGRMVGRGAVDIKGPMAVQVYSATGLLRMGERPRRDVVFTGVVQEETGGAGAVYWARNLDYPVALVVLGEPCSNKLSLGHRGMLSLWVTFHGKSVHASVPERGQNPNYMLAAFLQRLEQMQGNLKSHPLLGKTTVSPTIIEVDTKSKNVTPAWARVLLDFRTAVESHNSLQAFIQQVAGDLAHTITAGYASETLEASDEPIYGYYTAPDSEVVRQVRAAIERGTGEDPPLSSYRFATDGRHFVPYGMPIVGYAPGDEFEAHTAGESIAISEMADSLRGYMQLLRDF